MRFTFASQSNTLSVFDTIIRPPAGAAFHACADECANVHKAISNTIYLCDYDNHCIVMTISVDSSLLGNLTASLTKATTENAHVKYGRSMDFSCYSYTFFTLQMGYKNFVNNIFVFSFGQPCIGMASCNCP